jgi:hypothetical protein
MTVVDMLRDFPSCQCIPLSALLGILPQIPPRYYSVSSSPLEHNQLSLTVAFSVVDYMTPSLTVEGKEQGLRRKKGVATSFLEVLGSPFLAGADKAVLQLPLKIFPKPTQEFRMPSDLATPMVLIGPGTGIGKQRFSLYVQLFWSHGCSHCSVVVLPIQRHLWGSCITVVRQLVVQTLLKRRRPLSKGLGAVVWSWTTKTFMWTNRMLVG